MGNVRSYRDLVVWQKAIELAVGCYSLTKSFPRSEIFGLSSQLQRAAVSVAINIAEGHGRNGPREFLHFLLNSRGSLRETETLLIISNRVGYSKTETHLNLLTNADEIGRMLFALSEKIAVSSLRGSPLRPAP